MDPIERARCNDPTLTSLDVLAGDVYSLGFMIGNTTLRRLNVESGNLEAIHAITLDFLRDNTTLTDLILINCGVSDLEPLRHNTTLKVLNVTNNRIRSLDALRDNLTLEKLYLDMNQIDTLEPLRHNITLNTLYVKGNNIETIEPLSGNTTITHLRISHNRISDLTHLKGMPIFSLGIDNNPIDDISVLGSMPTLTHLSMSNLPVVSISSLVGCPNLETLTMQSCRVSDISPLGLCPSLTSVHANWNPIQDISFLSTVTNLKSVALHGCQIETLPRFGRESSVSEISLNENRISCVPTDTFRESNVRYVKLASNLIDNVEFLLSSLCLWSCDLSRNRISDLGVLKDFRPHAYITLHLDANPINDLSPLWGNTMITWFSFTRNNGPLPLYILKQYKTLSRSIENNQYNEEMRRSLRHLSRSYIH